jgi:hypothetical protein
MPQNDRAGFGLMILSNALPNGGNGTFNFTVDVSDSKGTTTLGPRTVLANNAAAQNPFGTIDTPAQGGTVSGTVVNFGWVLAPGGNVIPTNGSTIDVVMTGPSSDIRSTISSDRTSPSRFPGTPIRAVPSATSCWIRRR